MTLKQKIQLIENLPEANGDILAEARIAQDALARERLRHETEMRLIAERFEHEAWRWVEKHWTKEEIQAARTVGR